MSKNHCLWLHNLGLGRLDARVYHAVSDVRVVAGYSRVSLSAHGVNSDSQPNRAHAQLCARQSQRAPRVGSRGRCRGGRRLPPGSHRGPTFLLHRRHRIRRGTQLAATRTNHARGPVPLARSRSVDVRQLSRRRPRRAMEPRADGNQLHLPVDRQPDVAGHRSQTRVLDRPGMGRLPCRAGVRLRPGRR